MFVDQVRRRDRKDRPEILYNPEILSSFPFTQRAIPKRFQISLLLTGREKRLGDSCQGITTKRPECQPLLLCGWPQDQRACQQQAQLQRDKQKLPHTGHGQQHLLCSPLLGGPECGDCQPGRVGPGIHRGQGERRPDQRQALEA